MTQERGPLTRRLLMQRSMKHIESCARIYVMPEDSGRTMLLGWWRRQFLWVELGVAVVLTAALVVWSEKYGGKQFIETLLKTQRGTVYGVLASVFGSLLGFVITTVSIV